MPHVPRGRRHRPGIGPAAVVHAGVHARDGRGDRIRADPQGPGRCSGVPAHQPPVGLSGLRQGRRVPAPGPDHGLRPRREPVRRGEAPLREADTGERQRHPGQGAVHPLRPVHPFRRRGGRRPTDPLHGPWRPDPGQHVPGPALLVLLQRQHGPGLSRRGADRPAVQVQGPPMGPRRGGVDQHPGQRR